MSIEAVTGSLSRLVEEWKPDILQTHAVKSHFLVALSPAALAALPVDRVSSRI